MSAPLSKHYDASTVEPAWIKRWQEGDYAAADDTANKAPYSITLPPPNVTGSLHMGHALGGTIQDILIRWMRMSGRNAMWMPGQDHAGIATQMVVERMLKRTEDVTRHDLGRDKFLERVWKWKEEYGGKIYGQAKRLGFSLDWKRDRFTMDEGASRAVREVFVKLYEDDLIYRAHRLVNWCTDCYTAVSDLEVNKAEERGSLWELRYPIAGTDRTITVATTRPETMLGDTGVAVHPDDDRYKDVVGKMIELPLTDRKIPIVADTFVDPEFGSGAVKVTPAHDQNDFDCGKRCELDSLSVIGKTGKIIDPAPEKYRGMTVLEARKAVVADLDTAGLLGEVTDYKVARGRCDRSNTIIEPLLSDQWWVKTESLAAPAIEAVESGKTEFVPALWSKTYMHWMKNITDWCISRQLWWGHRIPAWYCDGCDKMTVAREEVTQCAHCEGTDVRQDEDVLDTWFSSALWPFSTLGWPEKTPALATFYPNDVLVTGPDIIFFWVARMMMMGIHFMGDVPFRKVYLTPIVTDEDGNKMSKVKGNVIDPLAVVNGATFEGLMKDAATHPAATKYIKKNLAKGISPAGADALRFSLAAMAMPGRNIRLSMERIEGYRHFVNKLWNASRFAMMNLEGFDAQKFDRKLSDARADLKFSLADRWILSRLQRVCTVTDEALSTFRFAEAANALYHFVWHELCDWYIELAKASLNGEDADARFAAQGTLATVLEQSLRLLHPMMPHVTEEIWSKLPRPAEAPASLMVTVYPTAEAELVDEQAEATMNLLQDITSKIRSIRSTYNVPPSQRIGIEIRIADDSKRALVSDNLRAVTQTARVNAEVAASGEAIAQSAKGIVGSDIEIVIPLAGLVDIDAEKARIAKELKKSDKEIAFIEKKLGNPKFVAKAPAEVVEEQKTRLVAENERKERLIEARACL